MANPQKKRVQRPSIFLEANKEFLDDIYNKGIVPEMEKRARLMASGRYRQPYSDRTLDKLERSAQGNMKKAVQQAGFRGEPKMFPADRTEYGQRALRMQYHPNDGYYYTPVQRRRYKAPPRRMSGMAGMGAGLGIGQLLREKMNKEQPSKKR